jgi:hypothetical protein
MEIGAVEESVVGGVWQIAAVETEDWQQVKSGGKLVEQPSLVSPSAVGCAGNRFSALEVGEVPDDLEEDYKVEEWPKVEVATRFDKKGKLRKEYCGNYAKGKCGVEEVACCAVGCPPGLSASYKKIGKGEITVDSAAEESVCPREWYKEFGTKEPAKRLKFINASGGTMGHY